MEINNRQQGAALNPTAPAQGAKNPTDRPTFADLAPMLADAAQEYGTRRHDGGSLNDEETATELITTLGGLAEELAITDISAKYISALMAVVNEYAMTASAGLQQERANNAAAALRQIVELWGLIKDYRPYLWQFTNAAARYGRELNAAIAAERAETPLNSTQTTKTMNPYY